MVTAAKTDTIRRLIGLFEKMDVDQALTLFTENALYRFGNYPPAIGREAIAATTKASHLDQIKSISFDIKEIWENGDAVIVQMEINYTRIDDSILTLPCTDIFRMEGDLVQEMLVYMDASPLFAMSNPQQSTSNATDVIKRALAAVESNNIDEYITYFTDDAAYKIANAEPMIGPQAIREFALPVMQMFKSVSHDIKNVWELGDKVVSEVEVVYTRNDDKVFKFPCVNIIKMQGDKIREYQAFIDATPAFS